MNSQEIKEIVNTLKIEGKQIDYVINYLFNNNVYYIQAIFVCSQIYLLKTSEVESLVYKNHGYKKQMDEQNPFNNDFIDYSNS